MTANKLQNVCNYFDENV